MKASAFTLARLTRDPYYYYRNDYYPPYRYYRHPDEYRWHRTYHRYYYDPDSGRYYYQDW